MKVVECDSPVVYAGTMYKPFERYVVSDYDAMVLVSATSKCRWKVSNFSNYEKRYGGQKLRAGQKVCIYRHTAWGDQLMISAVPRYLKTLYPEVTISHYCEERVHQLWWQNPYVNGSALPLPMVFETVMKYDYHIFYEGMLENNREQDQRCCYDDAFEFCGLTDVPAKYKLPNIQTCPEDFVCRYSLREDLPMMSKYLVYHFSPANKNRCYPPELGMMFVNDFLNEHPDYKVVLVGDATHGTLQTHTDKIINLIGKTKKFRDLIGILEGAQLVVCPDSSVLHLSAALNTPTVSLWGLLPSKARAQYYPLDTPLEGRGCPHTPCINHDFELPRNLCRDSHLFVEGESQYCCALQSIEPEYILAKVNEKLETLKG